MKADGESEGEEYEEEFDSEEDRDRGTPIFGLYVYVLLNRVLFSRS